MSAPNQTEIDNLKAWSIMSHYQRKRPFYIGVGKGLVGQGRALLISMQNTSQNIVANHTFSEDNVAAMLLCWLSSDPDFNRYLSVKTHLSASLKASLTDTLSRHIAHDGYSEITK